MLKRRPEMPTRYLDEPKTTLNYLEEDNDWLEDRLREAEALVRRLLIVEPNSEYRSSAREWLDLVRPKEVKKGL